MCGELSSGIELALAELRFRRDFVVIYRVMRDGQSMAKRSPAVTLWTAMQWARTCRRQHPELVTEIAPANRRTLQIQELERVGVECEGD